MGDAIQRAAISYALCAFGRGNDCTCNTLNTHWVVYNPNSSEFFMTDPEGNHVFVFDAATESRVASISIPGALGIDDTPDHKTVYVGTLIGDVYAIDVATLAVTHRYLASQIGPDAGYRALSVQVLADGRLALLGDPGRVFLVSTAPSSFAIWNSNDNSIVIYGNGSTGTVANDPFVVPDCVNNIGGFTRTVDRTAVLVGSIDSDNTLCEVNASTGQKNYVVAGGNEFSTAKIIISPDGRYIAFPGPDQVLLYDAHTLNLISQFSVSGDTSSANGMFFSADSKTLYVPTDRIIYAYDVTTHQQIGWLPNLQVKPNGFFYVGELSHATGRLARLTCRQLTAQGCSLGPSKRESVLWICLPSHRTCWYGSYQRLPESGIWTHIGRNPDAMVGAGDSG